MKPEVIVGNHQQRVAVPEGWLCGLEKGGVWTVQEIMNQGPAGGLAQLDCVEVALVDDGMSAKVHEQFMGMKGATDVITFEHGEIVISMEVARRQAAEYGEPELRELLRYLVHGLLHLAGYDDEAVGDRRRMEKLQEELVSRVWARLEESTPE